MVSPDRRNGLLHPEQRRVLKGETEMTPRRALYWFLVVVLALAAASLMALITIIQLSRVAP